MLGFHFATVVTAYVVRFYCTWKLQISERQTRDKARDWGTDNLDVQSADRVKARSSGRQPRKSDEAVGTHLRA